MLSSKIDIFVPFTNANKQWSEVRHTTEDLLPCHYQSSSPASGVMPVLTSHASPDLFGSNSF